MYLSLAPRLLSFILILDVCSSSLTGDYQALLDENKNLSRPASSIISSYFTTGIVGDPSVCSTAQQTVMDEWLVESQTLHIAIVAAYNNAPTDLDTRMLWSYLMGVKFTGAGQVVPASQSLWQGIQGRLLNVQQFLTGNGLPYALTSSPPYIFCEDDGAVKASWNQPAQDAQGNYVQTPSGSYLTISDVFYPHLPQLGPTEPFWVDVLKAYDIDDTKGAATLCGKPGRGAATSQPAKRSQLGAFVAGTPDKHTYFCDLAFNQVNLYTGIPLANAVIYTNYPTNAATVPAMRLQNLVPQPGTFYHELYHLTDSAGTTRDPYYTIEKISNAANSHAADIANNPESFLFMAVAAYIYQNPLTAPNDNSPAKPGLPYTVNGILQEIAAQRAAAGNP